MKRILCLIVVLFIVMTIVVPTVLAKDHHPSRIKLLVHAKHEIQDNLFVRNHFILGPDLSNGTSPFLYFGLGWQPNTWFDIEPVLGWNFKGDELIYSLRIAPTNNHDNKKKKWYSWTDIEVGMPSRNGYWFSQIQYRINEWLDIGLEGEGWGNYRDNNSWCNGVGPNMIMKFGKWQTDIAVRFQDMDNEVKPELFIRLHLFP